MKPASSLLKKSLPLIFSLASAGWSLGAVTYVNPPDIVIPFTYGGVYLDIVTEGTSAPTETGGASGASYTISYGEPGSGDWDVNFFFGGAGVAHNTTFQPYRADKTDNLSAVHNLGLGNDIDGSEIAAIPSSPLEIAQFGGSGSGVGGGLDGSTIASHMGSGTNQFQITGEQGYIGFVLDPGTAGEQYGWIQVTLAADGSTGLIHDWAVSDQPIQVGAIPEPGSLALLLLGSLALIGRRRR